MFAEDLSVFVADFGSDATLDGVDVRVVFDDQTVDDLDVLTDQPSALIVASINAARGQVLAIGGSSYTVREVVKQPPDGAFVRLMLTRAP